MKRAAGQRSRVFAALAALLLLGGCEARTEDFRSERRGNPESIDLQRFVVLPRPPAVEALTAADIASARLRLERMDPAELRARENADLEAANALPWLTGSQAGRAFLAIDGPRVIVRGAPAAFCPVAFVESGAGSTPELAERALTRCIDAAPRDCGCEVIAAGSILLVPREEVAYATAIAARIRAPAAGLDGLLVAEQEDATTILRDLTGTVGRVTRTADGAVEVELARAGRFTGRSIPVGYRRGRLAERIYATDAAGRRLVLLIGFDPDELADYAGAWLAWPRD